MRASLPVGPRVKNIFAIIFLSCILGLPVGKITAYEEKWNRHSEQDETAAGECFGGENRVHQGLFPLHSE